MAYAFVDNQPVPVAPPMQTWADLLTLIDRDLDAGGRVVAEVRFDGVDEPTFRESAILGQPLTSIGRIDLVTATPAQLLQRCCREAADSVQTLRGQVARAANLFRTDGTTRAHESLATVATELSHLTSLVRTLQVGLVSTGIGDGGPIATDIELQQFTALVEGLLHAQQSGHVYAIADLLDDDLAPVLQSWEIRLRTRAD